MTSRAAMTRHVTDFRYERKGAGGSTHVIESAGSTLRAHSNVT